MRQLTLGAGDLALALAGAAATATAAVAAGGGGMYLSMVFSLLADRGMRATRGSLLVDPGL